MGPVTPRKATFTPWVKEYNFVPPMHPQDIYCRIVLNILPITGSRKKQLPTDSDG